MTDRKKINRNFCLRIIRRKEIQREIVIAAALAFFLASCSAINTSYDSSFSNFTSDNQ
ncbi:MAG: hypothetical protein AB4206_13810 [Xenococcaceae cyanobacterium]